MDKIFIKLAEEPNFLVLIFLFVSLLIAMGKYSWKLSAFITTWKTEHQHHENTLNKIEKKIDVIPEIVSKLELIYHNTMHQPLVASNSPIGLTDFGKKIATNIKADGFVERHYSLFLDCLGDDYQELNAFDIQKVLFSYIGGKFKENLNPKEMDIIKTKAYEIGLQDTDILQVIAVLARDKVLLELDREVKEVDKHDPNKG